MMSRLRSAQEAVVSDEAAPHDRSAGVAAPVIRAVHLSRAFGSRRALRPLDLELLNGERLAVMGANGAGKSTLLLLLATLLRPSTGVLEVCGFDAEREPQKVRRRLGVVLHETLLYPDLTVSENLEFFARLYKVHDVRRRRDTLLERLGLASLRGRRVRRLSRGQQQRTALARALIHDPSLLLLDEPDTGLDVGAFELLSRELAAEGRTVVLTTHDPDHALRLASRLLLLRDGRAFDLGPSGRWSAADLRHAVGGV